MGLLGMQERVSLVGGQFAIESLPGGGTEVRAGFAVGEKAPSKSAPGAAGRMRRVPAQGLGRFGAGSRGAAVSRGETYLSPAVSKRVVDDYGSRTGGAADPLDALTPRQREILQLAAEGHSSKEIAQRLGLSPRTVEAHRAQLMERLDLHDVAGLVRFAVKVGLVTPGG
jgi:DNA-binding CsgD family transcriptional regulator